LNSVRGTPSMLPFHMLDRTPLMFSYVLYWLLRMLEDRDARDLSKRAQLQAVTDQR
jgi:hypothetical protein